MRSLVAALSLCSLALCATNALALDAAGERYTKMLASGGPGTIGAAAEDIYNSGAKDREVLDVAAQVLEDIHLRNIDAFEWADATAWLCKALGNSGDGRYRPLLDRITASGISRRAKGHCEKSAKQLPSGTTDPFQAGSVNVENYKDGGPAYAAGAKKAAATPAPKAVAAAAPAGKPVDFGIIKEGMSSQEVIDLIGVPTAQTNHMTGKQFIPFNFGARDLQRMNFLYKGVGHIEFSLKSAYNGVFRVIKVIPDPGESGYP
jgi:hypothetical protein